MVTIARAAQRRLYWAATLPSLKALKPVPVVPLITTRLQNPVQHSASAPETHEEPA